MANQKVVVRLEPTIVVYTGATTNLINVGNGEGEIYAGLNGTASKIRTIKQGVGVQISTVGDTILIEAGVTGGTLTFVGSGSTTVTNPSGNTYIVASPVVDTSTFVGKTAFDTYSGNTATAICLKADKASLSVYTGTTAPNTFVPNTRFNTYTGTTAPATYATKTSVSTYTGTTAPNTFVAKTNFNTYTGNTSTSIGLKADKSSINTYTGTTAPNTFAIIAHTHSYTGSTILNKPSFVGSGATNVELVNNVYRIFTPVVDTSTFASKSSLNTYTGTTAPATFANKTSIATYTGTTAPASFVAKTAFNTYSGTTVPTALNLKADKTSIATYTGTTAPASYQSKSSIATYTGTTAPASFAPYNSTITGRTTTTSIVSSYVNKIVECDGTFTVTLGNGLPTGARIDIINVGTGVITIAASGTLQSAGTKLATQFVACQCYHRGSDVWIALGRLST